MRLRPLWSTLAAVALLTSFASFAHAQNAAPAPRPKRAVIVTGENSYNGHVWKETSVELKNILDAGKTFARTDFPKDGIQIWSFLVDSSDPKRVYAGGSPITMYRSDDGGKRWESIENGLPSTFGFPAAAGSAGCVARSRWQCRAPCG